LGDKAKIIVVDDSAISRAILSKAIEKIEDAECVATAASGKIALAKVQSLKPDVAIIDVMMPEMDGVETLSRLKEILPSLQIIMMSSFDMENVKITLKSLHLGALDFISKPVQLDSEQSILALSHQISALIQVVLTKKYLSACSLSTSEAPLPPFPLGKGRVALPLDFAGIAFQIVVLGISTGGPQALAKLIPCLSPEIPCPVVIVQHMPPTFTRLLAENLSLKSRLPIKEAEDGEVLQKGTVYIAPGGHHLRLRKNREQKLCALSEDSPPVNNCRPAVDVLFLSAAEVLQERILAVVMTGMGRDGTEGIRALKRRKNNFCLIQDQSSSVVWGMPGSIHEAHLADEIVSLEEMGQRIMALTHQTKERTF
jgi:two-component system chemotaxis response regulator CheB